MKVENSPVAKTLARQLLRIVDVEEAWNLIESIGVADKMLSDTVATEMSAMRIHTVRSNESAGSSL